MTPPPAAEPLELLWVLIAVAALPAAFLALTAFAKIATVLQIVRSALGIAGFPSNAVVLALSGALTLLAMAPVATQVAERLEPLVAEPQLSSMSWLQEASQAVVEPLRSFLEANASESEKQRFLEVLQRNSGDRAESSDLRVLVPAFLVTELLRAFSLGFAIYLPFLVIDLLVANVLVGLGMQAFEPRQLSLPFKLLLFVATDGWGLLAEVLVSGYQ